LSRGRNRDRFFFKYAIFDKTTSSSQNKADNFSELSIVLILTKTKILERRYQKKSWCYKKSQFACAHSKLKSVGNPSENILPTSLANHQALA